MSKRFTLTICIIFLTTVTMRAQSGGPVSGRLVDAGTREAIIGAVIEVAPVNAPEKKKHYTTEANGTINIKSLDTGRYTFTFSYLGYKSLEKTVDIGKNATNLGTLTIEPEALTIDKVTFEVPAMRTSVKGDTVSYNAAAFKVAADADTEGLLAKMPGITVSGGTVEAQGEEVKRVLVDGREFFGEDVASAIKNLPAEVVDRIEVYDKRSDQSEFTGIDDGQGYRAINIVTLQDKRSGQFGKLYAGWGFNGDVQDRYIVGGNVNLFQGTSRISLIGLANNLNQQNFAFEDILGVVNTSGTSSGGGRMSRGGGGGVRGFMIRPEAGLASVQSFGINYSDTWGKKVNITGSYFFNNNSIQNMNYKQSWFYEPDGIVRFTNSETWSDKSNYNHRFNARIDYKINENHNLMIRPSISFQGRDNYENIFAEITNITDMGGLNELSERIRSTETRKNEAPNGYNANLNLLYRVKLGKPGRTLTVNMSGNYGKNDNVAFTNQKTFREQQATTIYNIRKTINDSHSYRLNGGLTYTEQISKNSSFNVEYRANYNYSDADRRVFIPLNYLYPDIFNPEFEEALSNIYNSGYLTNRINPGYRFNNDKLNLNVNVTYQNASMRNEQEYPAKNAGDKKYSFDNILYSGMVEYKINQANNLRLHANSDTRNPSIRQLQNVFNDASTNNLSQGNPELAPTYTNRVNLRYTNANVSKGRSFSFAIGANMENGYIADEVTTKVGTILPNGNPLEPGQQFSMPVNMDGRWSLWANTSYGLPVGFLKSNLNFELGGYFANTPGMINKLNTKTTQNAINGGITLSSNISENIDFTFSWRGNYDISRDESNSLVPQNRSFSQVAAGAIKWVAWAGITFSGNISYNKEKGITQDYNQEYILCNIYLGKKIFKNRRGEISFGVNDLLDQNTAFRRNVTASMITNTLDSAIGRYFSVQFVYNLRNFGKRASRNSGDYQGLDNQSDSPVGVQRSNTTPGGRPGGHGGPPPGGFRP